MSTWTTVLSLLVALIAVIGAVAPAIKQMLTPSTAIFRLSDPEVQPGEIKVRATNLGGQPAVLDRAVIAIPQRRAGQPYLFILEASDPPAEQEVAPGESTLLTFTFDRRVYDPPQIGEGDEPCTLEIYDSVRQLSCDEVRFLASTPPPDDRRGRLPEEGPAPLASPSAWERYRD